MEEFSGRSISPPVNPPSSNQTATAARSSRARSIGAWLALSVLLLPATGFAACTDQAAPRVDWRRCLHDQRDLRGVDLTEAHLRDASFSRAQLNGARMARADAVDARFVSADLAGADFTLAILREADLTRATLRGATLVRADLRRARLFRADLREADLTDANLAGADLSGALLDGARWIDGARICAVGSVGGCQ